MKKQLLLFVAMLLPMVAMADAVEIDGIYYNLISKTKAAEVTSSPNKYQGSIVIPESLKQLHDSHTQWLGQEKQTLDDHHRQQEESWQKHSQQLTDIVKNNEGVWISTKLFYIVGLLSLLSIITIAIEIAFYVYSHWIQ